MSEAEMKTYQAKDQNGDILYESDSWSLVVTYLTDWLQGAVSSLHPTIAMTDRRSNQTWRRDVQNRGQGLFAWRAAVEL